MIGECLKGVCLFAHFQKTVENGKNRNLLCARSSVGREKYFTLHFKKTFVSSDLK